YPPVMNHSRRRFMQCAVSMSALMAARVRADRTFQPTLLSTQKEVWDQQLWMAKLGPKYTGNKAHTTFVEFLAAELKKAGCDVAHDRYTLPRWDATRWSIDVTPGEGLVGFNAPVTSYFPYSGQTSESGV